MRPMTDDEVMAAALSDPDAQPLTADDLKRMKRIPRAKIIRRALGLTRRICRALFHSSRHLAGLGAGGRRAGHLRARLPDRDCAQS